MILRRTDRATSSETTAPTADATERSSPVVDAWLAVLMRMLRLPPAERSAIREELEEHLRERIRDLILSGTPEPEAQRIAVKELGETAALARRLELANRSPRRRLAMQLSMIALGAVAVTTGALVLSPDAAGPQASVFEEQAARSTPPMALSEFAVDLSADDSIRVVVERIDAAIPQSILVRWPEIEAHGANPDHPIQVDLAETPVPEAMRLIVEIMNDLGTFGWRFGPEIVELAPQRLLDRRDSALICYPIARVLESIQALAGDTDENARDRLVELVETMVETDSWLDNGGTSAHLMVVGAKMFVQAPPRMHERIEWILAELGGGADLEFGGDNGGDVGGDLGGDAGATRPALDGEARAPAPGAGARLDEERLRLLAQLRTIVLTCEPDDPAYREARTRLEQLGRNADHRIAPGDCIEVQVYELYAPGEWAVFLRRIDQVGVVRLPEIGAIPAAGITEQELEELIRTVAAKEVLADPRITVTIRPDDEAVSLGKTPR